MLLSKFNNDAQRSRILDGRILAFRQAYTKVGFYFIACLPVGRLKITFVA